MHSPYGTLPIFPAKQLPTKQPLTFSRYTIDLDQIRVMPGDCSPFAAAQLTVQPSGDGEMFAAFLSVEGSLATFWLASGVAGRNYDINVLTATEDNQALAGVWGIECDRRLAVYPLPPEPNPGPGSPITWSTGNPPMFGPIMNLPPITVQATGTTQTTAAIVSQLAVININAATAAGAGVQIGVPASTWNGQDLRVANTTNVAVEFYLYSGDAYVGQAVNTGITLQPQQSVTLSVSQGGAVLILN